MADRSLTGALARPLPRLRLPERLRVRTAAIANERSVVFGLALITLLAHSFNMFNYPSFSLLDDEGI